MAELGFHLPSLIVFLVNFGILLAVLYFFGYKRILAMLDQRSANIRDSLSEADRVRQEATQARQDLEVQLGESRLAGQQVLDEARQAAERYRVEEQEKARAEAEEFLLRARAQIEQERNQAIEKVREQFAELAISAAERVIDRSLDRDAHRDLIEKALSDSAEAQRN
ncbi:MAG: F0F1 ATP synthase subunit B [Chloroflexota bacterium]|nr:F0F1 ATP synthase subunit B [Chloroflexota bacterium]